MGVGTVVRLPGGVPHPSRSSRVIVCEVDGKKGKSRRLYCADERGSACTLFAGRHLYFGKEQQTDGLVSFSG